MKKILVKAASFVSALLLMFGVTAVFRTPETASAAEGTTAVFVEKDMETVGNWNTKYGSDGHFLLTEALKDDAAKANPVTTEMLAGQDISLPEYVSTFEVCNSSGTQIQNIFNGYNDLYPDRMAITSDGSRRLTGNFYSYSNAVEDLYLHIGFNDGQEHTVAVYMRQHGDPDPNSGYYTGRHQYVYVTDAEGNVLIEKSEDTEYNGSELTYGGYFVFKMTGEVRVAFNCYDIDSVGCVVSGVFFGEEAFGDIVDQSDDLPVFGQLGYSKAKNQYDAKVAGMFMTWNKYVTIIRNKGNFRIELQSSAIDEEDIRREGGYADNVGFVIAIKDDEYLGGISDKAVMAYDFSVSALMAATDPSQDKAITELNGDISVFIDTAQFEGVNKENLVCYFYDESAKTSVKLDTEIVSRSYQVGGDGIEGTEDDELHDYLKVTSDKLGVFYLAEEGENQGGTQGGGTGCNCSSSAGLPAAICAAVFCCASLLIKRK